MASKNKVGSHHNTPILRKHADGEVVLLAQRAVGAPDAAEVRLPQLRVPAVDVRERRLLGRSGACRQDRGAARDKRLPQPPALSQRSQGGPRGDREGRGTGEGD